MVGSYASESLSEDFPWFGALLPAPKNGIVLSVSRTTRLVCSWKRAWRATVTKSKRCYVDEKVRRFVFAWQCLSKPR
jgi:hypothetical protein